LKRCGRRVGLKCFNELEDGGVKGGGVMAGKNDACEEWRKRIDDSVHGRDGEWFVGVLAFVV
jgi:hypothetical protein